jgi:hypothetical protein
MAAAVEHARESKAESAVKRCPHCHETKPLTCFIRLYRGSEGRVSWCRSCRSESTRRLQKTRRGFLAAALAHTREFARKRLRRGRFGAGIHILPLTTIEQRLGEQEDRCAISRLPMVCMRSSPWALSIDRIDDAIGYTPSNVRLIAAEFNCASKWSPAGLRRLHAMAKQGPLTDDEWSRISSSAETLVLVPKRPFQGTLDQIESQAETLVGCSRCQSLWLPEEVEGRGRMIQCRRCASDYRFTFNTASVACELRQLWGAMKGNTARRSRVRAKRGLPPLAFELTLDDMLRLYLQQRGRCAYSGVPFHHPGIHGGDQRTELLRRLSPERLDPRRGYEHGNVCFVIRGFQAADHLANIKYSNGGSAGWSKLKVNYVWQWLDEEAAGATQPSMTWAQFEQRYNTLTSPRSPVASFGVGVDSV